MKKLIIAIISMCSCVLVSAQEFSMKLYFEAANGEKDTLIIGYSENATVGVDYGTPISPDRFQAFIIGPHWDGNSEFHSKKQIIKNVIYNRAIDIIVPFESLPLTIRWDKTLFNDLDREYSVITDWIRGGWFDATAWHHILEDMKDVDSIVFPVPSEYNFSQMRDYGYRYIKDDNQVVEFYLIHVGFINREEMDCMRFGICLRSSINDIEFADEITQIEVYSISGKKMLHLRGKDIKSNKIQNLPNGIYIVVSESKNHKRTYSKIIKN